MHYVTSEKSSVTFLSTVDLLWHTLSDERDKFDTMHVCNVWVCIVRLDPSYLPEIPIYGCNVHLLLWGKNCQLLRPNKWGIFWKIIHWRTSSVCCTLHSEPIITSAMSSWCTTTPPSGFSLKLFISCTVIEWTLSATNMHVRKFNNKYSGHADTFVSYLNQNHILVRAFWMLNVRGSITY